MARVMVTGWIWVISWYGRKVCVETDDALEIMCSVSFYQLPLKELDRLIDAQDAE